MQCYLGRCHTVLTSGCSSCPGVCDGACEGVGRTTHGSSLAPSLARPPGNPSLQAVGTHRAALSARRPLPHVVHVNETCGVPAPAAALLT